jgi:hypothetical protein
MAAAYRTLLQGVYVGGVMVAGGGLVWLAQHGDEPNLIGARLLIGGTCLYSIAWICGATVACDREVTHD